MTRVLVIGASGYVGRALVDSLSSHDVHVEGTSRQVGGATHLVHTGASLDRLVPDFDRYVVTAQLTAPGVDWVTDRVDGPNWLVLSSNQLASVVPAPGHQLALAREVAVLARGGSVFRPTMVFGRGGDRTISRLARGLRRWRLPLLVDGDQLLQPLHVDDLVALIGRYVRRPVSGAYEVAGDEAVTLHEVLDMVREIIGVRAPPVRISTGMLESALPALRLLGLRADQVRRLKEDKTADVSSTARVFDWWPEPLGNRIEQSVWEALT